jgi:hypothetical protein
MGRCEWLNSLLSHTATLQCEKTRLSIHLSKQNRTVLKNVKFTATYKKPYQYSFPVTPKDKFTAKKRAKIEAKVRKGMQDYSKEKRTNPYIDMFGSLTEQDLRSSLESEYLQKKEKLANSRVSNR